MMPLHHSLGHFCRMSSLRSSDLAVEYPKNDKHALGCTLDGFRLLWLWRCWLFHCKDGCLVVPIDPSHVPSDDPQHEGWVIQDTLKISTDFSMEFLLIRGQQPGHELIAMLCVFKSDIRITCTDLMLASSDVLPTHCHTRQIMSKVSVADLQSLMFVLFSSLQSMIKCARACGHKNSQSTAHDVHRKTPLSTLPDDGYC